MAAKVSVQVSMNRRAPQSWRSFTLCDNVGHRSRQTAIVEGPFSPGCRKSWSPEAAAIAAPAFGQQ